MVLHWINVVIAGYLSGNVSVDWEELWAELYQPSPWSSKLRLNTAEHGNVLALLYTRCTMLPEHYFHKN